MTFSGHRKLITRVFWVYLCTWGLTFLLFLWQLLQQGRTFTDSANIFFTEAAPNKTFLILLHLLFALLFLLFLAYRYLRKVFEKSGAKPMFKRLGLYYVLPFTLLFAGVKTLVHVNTYEPVTFSWDERVMNSSGRAGSLYELDGMHRGISVLGWRNANEQAIADIIKTNAEWVAIIPFIYQENESSLKLKSDRTQYLAYEALFSELWHQNWFAGVYIWEWNTRSKKESADTDLNFSPRFKPAENVITKWFGKQSQ